MSKKLLGERQIGDKVYEAGTVFTDDEATATGLPATDFVTHTDVSAPAPAEATPAAEADADADADTQAADADSAQKAEDSSAPSGSDVTAPAATEDAAGDNGDSTVAAATETESTDAAPAAEDDSMTVEHTLTEQDLLDNPELGTEQNLKAGDTVRLPAVEKVLTQEDIDADADLTAQGLKVGDTVLVAKEV